MKSEGVKIHFTMPRTLPGRVIGAILTIAGVLLTLFFFAAILIIVALVIAGFVLWSALSRRKRRTSLKADGIPAEYEVLDGEDPAAKGTGERQLPPSKTIFSIIFGIAWLCLVFFLVTFLLR